MYLVFVVLCINLGPFYLCNHFDEEERAGCYFNCLSGCRVTASVLWLFLTVPWVGLQCIFVVCLDLVARIYDTLLSLTL